MFRVELFLRVGCIIQNTHIVDVRRHMWTRLSIHFVAINARTLFYKLLTTLDAAQRLYRIRLQMCIPYVPWCARQARAALKLVLRTDKFPREHVLAPHFELNVLLFVGRSHNVLLWRWPLHRLSGKGELLRRRFGKLQFDSEMCCGRQQRRVICCIQRAASEAPLDCTAVNPRACRGKKMAVLRHRQVNDQR